MGHLYKRGNIWWMKYYRNGKPYFESTKSKNQADAKRLLKRREGDVAKDKLPITFDRVFFEELVDALRTDYKNNNQNLTDIEYRLNHLTPFFENTKVVNITTSRVEQYKENRLEQEGAANATVNRELAALKRMFSLGAQQGKVDRIPHIPMLKENNVRKGFFEHGDFLALREALPDYLKPFVTFAYKTGWRSKEISELKWSQVDLEQGIVRLEAGETKNDQPRTVYLDDELLQMFKELRKQTTPHVFTNNGKPIKYFSRYMWNKACRETGLGYGYKVNTPYVEKWQDKLPSGPILQDFRRTACRNMVRAGIPERVAMMVSGHKTRTVFDRYNIVSDADLKIATQKTQTYLQAQKVTKTVTIHSFKSKKEKVSDS